MEETQLKWNLVILHLIITLLFGCANSSTSEPPDETHNMTSCDELVLVDKPRVTLHNMFGKMLPDHISCPVNNGTTQRCIITFRGRSSMTRRVYRLCTDGDLTVGCSYNTKIIVTSSTETMVVKCHDPSFSRKICAPLNEDLQVIYESDNICPSGYEILYDIRGTMDIVQKSAFRNSYNLINKYRCYSPISLTYNWERKGTILSNYEPEWSEKQYFCEAIIITDGYTTEVCFFFLIYVTYPQGASMVIASGSESLKFNDLRPNPENSNVCLPVKGKSEISIKVVPGMDPYRKLHHTFYFHFHLNKDYAYHDGDDDGSHDYNDHDDKDDDSYPTQRNQECIQPTRTDSPNMHPAFLNASRYTTSTPSTQLQAYYGHRNMGHRPTETVTVPLTIQTQTHSTAERFEPNSDSCSPPPYESLFPSGKDGPTQSKPTDYCGRSCGEDELDIV